MTPLKGVLLLSFVVTLTIAAENSTQKVKPAITRTSLHVARSLNPADSELLTVRSKNGEVATLIVKRREGKNSLRPSEGPTNIRSSSVRESKEVGVPKPVEVRSDVMFVKDDTSSKKKGRNLQTMTVENGVPVIEGVREPDAPEDKFHTWRNAKVINGVLVPYKQSLSGEIPLKSKPGEKGKPEKQEVTLSSYFEANEQKPSMFGKDDMVTTQWKGIAETIPVQKETRRPIPLVFSDPDRNQAKIIEYIMKINQKELQNRRKSGRSIDFIETPMASRRMDENVDENEEPIWVNTQPKEIWTDEGKISVADRRMDRMEDSIYDKDDDKFVPIAPVQARLLQPQGVSNYPTSSIYSSQPSRVSFEEGVRTPVLQYAHPELGAQPAKVERDADELDEGKPKDPHSSLPSLTYFSNDPYADRSPYAYEPGLAAQSDDSLPPDSNLDVSNNIGGSDREISRRQSIRNIEFTTSSSEGSSINPDEIDITESPNRLKSSYYGDRYGDRYRDSYGLGNDNYLQSYQHYSYPGKYSMTKEDYYKWKMSGMSYGNTPNSNGYYVKVPDNRPLWEKITDSIKETVQSSVESMKEMTRPVMEPLVEATQRISENLGIPEATAKISSTLGLNQGTGMRTALQEKIGAAASSSPVLLPALGLVGAGAALGLGAVAVGRLLDVNVNLLRRSESGAEPADASLAMEHKRAMEAVTALPTSLTGDSLSRNAKSLPINSEKIDKESKTDFKRLIDESGIEGLEKFHFDINENSEESKSRRRSLGAQDKAVQEENDAYLKKLEDGKSELQEIAVKLGTLGQPEAWRNLPCAQRAFCEALVKQTKEGKEEVEKILSQNQDKTTSSFASKVVASAKSQDCTSFVCHRKIRR